MPTPMNSPCKHPQVRVVAREEDAEYVECQQCGEVFEASEFRDMELEEQPQEEDTEP
ncbi:hypothetical protein ACP_2542 [Acidobacterium capsulatum ATCC 51196]|uniref:Uncharacterized protein n=1 Tax=Acidobacterium capsulatum (strain ATCC 51196 / DSM 11244 / BCRC 80197 / JCM 7670 / NBRC 15755 / NCIMB 13165 / 161) TaxID=240015 RepID=C1F1Z4_ACIC5|nr:hypothetical protein ACP_2542 [Acidobacterium capsulatum ATCC 51196]